jgi:hypothetical protein
LTPVSDERTAADRGLVALAAMRILIGALAWARPESAARLFGMPAPDGQARYLWRLFGARDLVIGTATVTASGARRRTWAGAGLACDVADGAAGTLARGEVGRLPAAAMIGVPVGAVAYGAWALASPRRR